MNYVAFSKKALKEIRKNVLNNRIDSRDVLGLKFKERFTVELGSTTGLTKDPLDLLSIIDTEYNVHDNSINLYKIYNQMNAKEITKEEAINLVIEKTNNAIEQLFHIGLHYFDQLNAQIKYDKEHGINADYSDWYRR